MVPDSSNTFDHTTSPPSCWPSLVAATRSVGVIGAGYVGVVTAAALASLGHRVRCLDIDESRLSLLRASKAPFHEPQLDDLLAMHRESMDFTSSPDVLYRATDIIFVCVDTPPTAQGDADLSRVDTVIDAIPHGWRGVVAMKSTVPVGTGARVEARLRQRGLDAVRYVSNPEFLREGSAIDDVFHPDRVVAGGSDLAAVDAVLGVWESLGGERIRCDIASAELIKLAANAFLATKISFINEIANLCDQVGADVSVVAQGMGSDRRIGPAFLQAGIGYGGSCFPKDVVALKQLAGNVGYHFQLLSSVVEVNNLQRRRLLSTLKMRLGPLRGRRITLLGLSFKPGTDDLREAPSLTLALRLVEEGAVVVAHDPVVSVEKARSALGERVAVVSTLEEAVLHADAVMIVTDWPEYKALLDPAVRSLMHRPLILDGRNLLDPVEAARAGYEWVGVGRPTHTPGGGWERGDWAFAPEESVLAG